MSYQNRTKPVGLYYTAAVAQGVKLLIKNKTVIFACPIDYPTEDIDCDDIAVSKEDYDRTMTRR